MAMRRTIMIHARSIVGAALLLLGTFLCYAHLSHAAALWSDVFVGSPGGATGGFSQRGFGDLAGLSY